MRSDRQQALQGIAQGEAVRVELAHLVEHLLRIVATALLPQHFAQMHADIGVLARQPGAAQGLLGLRQMAEAKKLLQVARAAKPDDPAIADSSGLAARATCSSFFASARSRLATARV